MMVHPGKTLNFMGNEIAMFREWDETKEPDYFLLKYPMHDSFRHYFSELWKVYTETPALYEMDYEPEGFRWVTINDNGRNIFGIQRYAKDRNKGSVIALFNFSNRDCVYRLHPEKSCAMEEILNTDWERFSGKTREEKGRMIRATSMDGAPVALPAFSAVLYKIKQ